MCVNACTFLMFIGLITDLATAFSLARGCFACVAISPAAASCCTLVMLCCSAWNCSAWSAAWSVWALLLHSSARTSGQPQLCSGWSLSTLHWPAWSVALPVCALALLHSSARTSGQYSPCTGWYNSVSHCSAWSVALVRGVSGCSGWSSSSTAKSILVGVWSARVVLFGLIGIRNWRILFETGRLTDLATAICIVRGCPVRASYLF